MATPARLRPLDDWYRVVNQIYLDRNYYRDSFSIFTHLVEVVGGLSLLGTGRKLHIDASQFLPKAIAWWLALSAKVGIRSVEDMLWAKFPGVCPYCKCCPHESDPCLEAKKVQHGPDWKALAQIGATKKAQRPRHLGEWQKMFYEIYPTPNDPGYSIPLMRFAEELGELAEALRVAPIAPGYFLSEASDVFAWLMNLQNVNHSKQQIPHKQRGERLAASFWDAYPDRCNDCRNPVCTCPPVLPSTLGRIAHEIPRDTLGSLPGGGFFSIEEAMVYFQLGDPALRLADVTLEADSALIQDIHRTVEGMRAVVVEHAMAGKATSARLSEAIAAIDTLASSQRVTQQSVDELARAISALPSESRSTIVGFLTGLESSLMATALAKVIGI